MTNMTFIKLCSPHSWAHAPTVGYYACINCRETVMYDDPRYIEIEAEQAKQIAAMTNEQPEQWAVKLAKAIRREIILLHAQRLSRKDCGAELPSDDESTALTLQRAFTERTADLVAGLADVISDEDLRCIASSTDVGLVRGRIKRALRDGLTLPPPHLV